MMQLYGIVGLKGSGKDSIAKILLEHGFERYSFANVLKDLIATLFSWPRHLLEGDTVESREWREKPDEWWSKNLNMPEFTPRLALQFIGTDILRQYFHPDIWILSVENQLRQSTSEKIVITDCRFPNEINLIHRLKGKVIQVSRGELPVWWDLAKELNFTRDDSRRAELANLFETKYKVHRSERDWIGYPVDYVISNDYSLDDLKKNVEELLGIN